jgi:hypothetical protein
MPKHRHLGCYRLITVKRHGDLAENPAGQHIDNLEQHPAQPAVTGLSLPATVQVNHQIE